jgi:hypothetical protein
MVTPLVIIGNKRQVRTGCSARRSLLVVVPRDSNRALSLRKYHRGEVVKETPGKVPNTNNEFQMIAKYLECAGSGKLMEGECCGFCDGAGTVRIEFLR